MAGMSFIGSYSGIDQNTIDQLMQAERMPLKQLENKKVSITEKQNAWKDVNTRLNSLFEKMKALKTSSSFNTKTAVSSDDKFVSMSVGNSAPEGKYNISIKQLATNNSVIGNRVKDSEGKELEGDKPLDKELNQEGTFTIKNKDGIEQTITVKSTDSLRKIVENINLATKDSKDSEGKIQENTGTGISATILDNRIVLKDETTGARNIGLSDTDNMLSKIGLVSMSEVTYPLDKNEAEFSGVKFINGQDAVFNLNGIEITRSENRISDAIDGIVINLNKVHDTGQSDTVTISSDTEKAAKAMQDFVDQYNSTMKFIEEKTAAGDPKVPGSKGSLAGESSLIRLQTSLRTLVTDKLGVEGSNIKDASQIGISTVDKFGALTFDKAKFLEELGKDKDSVMNFLNPGKNAEGKDQIGLVDRVNDYINGFVSKSDGIIKDKNESYEKTLKDLASRIENFEARMVKKEAYYVKTFTALDLAMMKAEDQMGWLQGQVDSMNGVKR